MEAYRCYFLNRSNAITWCELIECNGDNEAQQLALEILRARPQHTAVEVWDHAGRVFPQGQSRRERP
jgi:hypothetical protein